MRREDRLGMNDEPGGESVLTPYAMMDRKELKNPRTKDTTGRDRPSTRIASLWPTVEDTRVSCFV